MGSKPSWVSGLAQALLQEEDVNVLVVDWVYGASFAYNLVVENYKEVAVQISVLINQLTVIFFHYESIIESILVIIKDLTTTNGCTAVESSVSSVHLAEGII